MLVCVYVCLSAGPAWAAGDEAPAGGPLERADLSEAYMDDELVSVARRGGLGQKVLRAIDEPTTPSDVRLALIDASARSGNSKDMARTYTRMLKARARGKELTLDNLATHELVALAHMRAHDAPAALSAMGGDSEFERATPLVLVTAAVNRQRGDQAIHLINGLIKAQQATATPGEALCAPSACMETAMRPFSREWAVRPGAVCAAYEATRANTKRSKGKLARMCALHAEGKAKGPVYAPDATAERDAKRFSKGTAQSGGPGGANPMGLGLGFGGSAGLGGVPVAIPPNATPDQIERLIEKALIDEIKRQDPMMGKLFEESLKMQKRSMRGSFGLSRPRARTSPQPVRKGNPQEIKLSPDDPDQDAEGDGGIVVVGGDDTSSANQEIILEAGDE